MKLSALVGRATYLLQKHGDFDVLDEDMHALDGIEIETSDGSFPEDWNLPEGTQYIQVTSNR